MSGFFNTENMLYMMVRLGLLLLVIPFHECAHSMTADYLGDDTGRLLGRSTLNPLPHLDLMGSALILFTGFGWAKPVPVSTRRFKNRKRDMAITALAGPAANLILAFIFVALVKTSAFFLDFSKFSFYAVYFIYMIIYSTLALAVFNMLPIPPLDGSRLLTALLPDAIYDLVMRYEQIIMAVLMLGLFTGVLDLPIGGAANFLFRMLDKATFFLGPMP